MAVCVSVVAHGKRVGGTTTVLLLAAVYGWLIAGGHARARTAGLAERRGRETSPGKSDDEGTLIMQSFKARELAEFGAVKRRHSPKTSLADWTKHGFGFEDERGAEFEALRVDEVESANTIRRIHARDVSAAEMKEIFEPMHVPIVIDGVTEEEGWETGEWTIPFLADKYPSMSVRVGTDDDRAPVTMKMKDYARYARTTKDDMPLYVFDTDVYDDKVGKNLMSKYRVPQMFDEDIFQLVEYQDVSPSYRWLLIGAKRSGSMPHSDPLSTSAWNTLISGRKLWFFAPPFLEDVVDQTSQKPIAKWFLDSLPELRTTYNNEITMYVQQPGETMFVPAFWMHAVLNLDDSVAVTQNFVSTHTFPDAWKLTTQHVPAFAKKLLKELTVHNDGLARIALEIDALRDAEKARWAKSSGVRIGVDDDDEYEDDDEDDEY